MLAIMLRFVSASLQPNTGLGWILSQITLQREKRENFTFLFDQFKALIFCAAMFAPYLEKDPLTLSDFTCFSVVTVTAFVTRTRPFLVSLTGSQITR